MKGYLGLAAFVGVMLTTFNVQAEITDRATGKSFPSDVSFNFDGKEYNLRATGVSTRKKSFVKVYSVAHYIEDTAPATNNFSQVLKDDQAKQLTIKWTYNPSAKKVQSGYREAFRKTVPKDVYPKIQGDIQQFVSFFNKNMRNGDETIIRWIPEGHVEVIQNGKVAGTITSQPFAEGLWNIWFGPDSVVNRDQLISMTN